jgi:outer membrane protein OmpA-like peptidoglycan-associated protein
MSEFETLSTSKSLAFTSIRYWAEAYNKRAVVAKEFLVSHGVPSQIIHISSLAAGDNIAPNTMSAGRALNRCVTIEIITR